MSQKQWIFTIIYILLFFVTANFDYAFSTIMTSDPPIWLSEFGNHFGCTIGVLILSFCFACLYQKYPKKKFYLIFVLIPSIIAGYYILYLKTIVGYICMVIIGILISFLMLKLSSYADVKNEKAFRAMLLGIVFVLSGVIFNTVVKCFWGRPRFFTLNSEQDFKPWYAIQGFVLGDDSHKSFPSGHVTNACFIVWIENLKYFYPKRSFSKITELLVCVIWISLTALSRIAAGMHFISDTTAAVGITLLFYVFLKKHYMDKSKTIA